jgi:hypothetical protein
LRGDFPDDELATDLEWRREAQLDSRHYGRGVNFSLLHIFFGIQRFLKQEGRDGNNMDFVRSAFASIFLCMGAAGVETGGTLGIWIFMTLRSSSIFVSASSFIESSGWRRLFVPSLGGF